MIRADMKQIKRLQSILGDLNSKGIKFAQRDTVNGLAFATQADARQAIPTQFTTRNAWTVRSVRVDRARSTRDSAEVGSTEQYMADQEFGARGGPANVPTPAATGESPRSKVRRRVVRKANRMNAIRLGRRARTGSKAQQNIVALKEAKESGRRFVYLDRGRVKGIYKVMGTKRRPKARMVQNLTRTVRVVKRDPWLAPATERQRERALPLYFKAMRHQLRRLSRDV